LPTSSKPMHISSCTSYFTYLWFLSSFSGCHDNFFSSVSIRSSFNSDTHIQHIRFTVLYLFLTKHLNFSTQNHRYWNSYLHEFSNFILLHQFPCICGMTNIFKSFCTIFSGLFQKNLLTSRMLKKYVLWIYYDEIRYTRLIVTYVTTWQKHHKRTLQW